jgi:hypothetical protein
MTPNTDLIAEFDGQWNNVAVTQCNVRRESEQCDDGNWILCIGINNHSIYPHNHLCARPASNGVGLARGRAPLMEWTDVYIVLLKNL